MAAVSLARSIAKLTRIPAPLIRRQAPSGLLKFTPPLPQRLRLAARPQRAHALVPDRTGPWGWQPRGLWWPRPTVAATARSG